MKQPFILYFVNEEQDKRNIFNQKQHIHEMFRHTLTKCAKIDVSIEYIYFRRHFLSGIHFLQLSELLRM